MNSRILKLEISGIFFISLLGSFLHFTFDLADKYWLVGAFSAVNESVWEHLKLAVIPAVLWAVLESRLFKIKNPNFLFAKAAGISLMPVSIIVFFYSYKAVLGGHNLLLDIAVFFLAVIVGQLASYKIMGLPSFSRKCQTISLAFLIMLLLAFAAFTFYPPRLFLFEDPVSGHYGIIKE